MTIFIILVSQLVKVIKYWITLIIKLIAKRWKPYQLIIGIWVCCLGQLHYRSVGQFRTYWEWLNNFWSYLTNSWRSITENQTWHWLKEVRNQIIYVCYRKPLFNMLLPFFKNVCQFWLEIDLGIRYKIEMKLKIWKFRLKNNLFENLFYPWTIVEYKNVDSVFYWSILGKGSPIYGQA